MSQFKQLIALSGEENYSLVSGVLSHLASNNISCLLSHVDFGFWGDGEPKDVIVLRDEIPGSDVIVFQTMNTPFLETQFMELAGASKFQYGARSVTAVLPFMRYRRQDHPNEEKGEMDRNSLLIKRMASMGVSRVVFCDIHSQITLDNCRRENIKPWNIEQTAAFAPALEEHVLRAKEAGTPIYILALDKGSIPRAITMAKVFGVKVAVSFKKRLSGSETIIIKDPEAIIRLQLKYGSDFLFDDSVLSGALVIIVDDELSTAGSSKMIGRHLRDLGVHTSVFCFTHAVCIGSWRENLLSPSPFDFVYSANTLEINYRKSTGGKIMRVDMAPVIGATLLEVIEDIKRG